MILQNLLVQGIMNNLSQKPIIYYLFYYLRYYARDYSKDTLFYAFCMYH